MYTFLKTTLTRSVTLCTALVGLSLSGLAADVEVPTAVQQTIDREFPSAKVLSVGKERERHVTYYEVDLREGDSKYGVEIAPDGSIGEIEARIDPADLPDDLKAVVKEMTKGGSRIRIEKHERRGTGKDGSFEQLEFPTLSYEVSYVKNGKRYEVELDGYAAILPEDVQRTLKKRYPKHAVVHSRNTVENGVPMYTCNLQTDREDLTVKMTKGGDILSVGERVVKLPRAVGETMKSNLDGGQVTRMEKVSLTALVKEGELKRLKDDAESYTLTMNRGNLVRQLMIDKDGTLVNATAWLQVAHPEKDDDEDDDGDEEDDDDD